MAEILQEKAQEKYIGEKLQELTKDRGVLISADFLTGLKASKEQGDQALYADLIAQCTLTNTNEGLLVNVPNAFDSTLDAYEIAYLRTQVKTYEEINVTNGVATIKINENITLKGSQGTWTIDGMQVLFEALPSALKASYLCEAALTKLNRGDFDAPTDFEKPFYWDGDLLSFRDEWIDSDILRNVRGIDSPLLSKNECDAVADFLNNIFRNKLVEKKPEPTPQVEQQHSAEPEKTTMDNFEKEDLTTIVENANLQLDDLGGLDPRGKQLNDLNDLYGTYSGSFMPADLVRHQEIAGQIKELADEIQEDWDKMPKIMTYEEALARGILVNKEDGSVSISSGPGSGYEWVYPENKEDYSVQPEWMEQKADTPTVASEEVAETPFDVRKDAQEHSEKYAQLATDGKSFTFIAEPGSEADLKVRIEDVVKDHQLAFTSARYPGMVFSYKEDGAKGPSWYNEEGNQRLGIRAGDVVKVVDMSAVAAAEPVPVLVTAPPIVEGLAQVVDGDGSRHEEVPITSDEIIDDIATLQKTPGLIKKQEDWQNQLDEDIAHTHGDGRREGLLAYRRAAEGTIGNLQRSMEEARASLKENANTVAYREATKDMDSAALADLGLPAVNNSAVAVTEAESTGSIEG